MKPQRNVTTKKLVLLSFILAIGMALPWPALSGFHPQTLAQTPSAEPNPKETTVPDTRYGEGGTKTTILDDKVNYKMETYQNKQGRTQEFRKYYNYGLTSFTFTNPTGFMIAEMSVYAKDGAWIVEVTRPRGSPSTETFKTEAEARERTEAIAAQFAKPSTAPAQFSQPSLATSSEPKPANPVAAPNTQQRSPDAQQFMASLDDALSKHDYTALAAKMRNPGTVDRITASLDWAQAKMIAGGSVIVSILYAESLWAIGSKVPESNPLAKMKDTAAMQIVYSMAVTMIDGPKCGDQSAPSDHLVKIISNYRPILGYLARLEARAQFNVLYIATEAEKKLAPIRNDNNYLCRFGLDEIGAALRTARPEDLEPHPPGPGQFGNQVVLPNLPDYEPKYVSEDVWKPKQELARRNFMALLSKVMDQLKTAPAQPVPQK